jgi:S-DNA-T family DNA segregation ATPase FtsK/SpoIIIE
MRKEILGIVLLFILVFTTISLLSYHPLDPSVNNVRGSGEVRNLFGPVGAHTAGLLFAVFGLGAFWAPVVLLIVALHIFQGCARSAVLIALVGGGLLTVATGAILSMGATEYLLLGKRFSGGGVAGIALGRLVEDYAGPTGGLIFLISIWAIAFIMTTRLSFKKLFRWLTALGRRTLKRLQDIWVISKERREKAKRRTQKEQRFAPNRKDAVKIVEPVPRPRKEAPLARQEAFHFTLGGQGYRLPSLKLLEGSKKEAKGVDHGALQMQSRLLEKKLNDFDVSGKVLAVTPGPVVTMYEYEPAAGVKINRIVNLADDLALALRAESIRIVAPIPGKAVIGIEVPNAERETVRLRDIIASEPFQKSQAKLTLALGKDIMGSPVIADLARMPHLLIAGATGSGKSVALNGMICSVLYKATPEEVKLILIDPKRIELAAYDDIPHLIVPVVVDARKATRGLHWAVQEMERRYALMAESGVRNIHQYNKKAAMEGKSGKGEGKPSPSGLSGEKKDLPGRLPLVLIVIDELADLMLVASRDVEFALTRLAQMARAAGIHLLIATQRPSVDVLTGIIKANFPTRISFQVSSRTDSRTILDSNGAEDLLGDGDMLLLPPGTAKLHRIHGAYVSESEIQEITDFLKRQKEPVYREEILEAGPEETPVLEAERDDKYDEAVALVKETQQASISMIQRRLRVGYNRAARMIEVMERDGIVGPSDGSKPREVLAKGV